MTTPSPAVFEAKVARYAIARLRLGQVLLPFAMVTGVVARRAPPMASAVIALVVIGAGLALFLSAVRRYGWQSIRLERGGLSIGSTGIRIERHEVHHWTLVSGSARLYGRKESFRLRARRGNEGEVEGLLRRQLGPPLALERRGSLRSRLIALGAGFCGLGIAALAIIDDRPTLALIGAPAFMIGIAAFAALSQRRAV